MLGEAAFTVRTAFTIKHVSSSLRQCACMLRLGFIGVGHRLSYKRRRRRNLSNDLLVVCCQWPVVHTDWFSVLGHSSAVHDEAAACGRALCLVRFPA